MSRMSQLHAELEQQAYEKGYESLDEALKDGATIIGETLVTRDDLIKRVGTKDAQEQAHKAWLKEKEDQLERLDAAVEYLEMIKEAEVAEIVKDTIDFIKKGEI